MNPQDLIPHLFRTEFSRISAVLSKLFGIGNIDLAEDIASETFLSALETWPYNGVPANPSAWLYAVAKNKTINFLQRDKLFLNKIVPEIKSHSTVAIEIDLSEKNISDSLLQMLFTLCHPSISIEGQIGLSLRILCGFGIDEIAAAFLTTKETINKRLSRAKQTLRDEKIKIEFPPPAELNCRLDAVLTTLYLLFSEGYYSEINEKTIREELCTEAMRLTFQLLENEHTNLPKVNALYALMCFHASRLAARKNDQGELILYGEQDESLWNRELIITGGYYLQKASQGTIVSKYHVEAAIAYWHTVKADTEEKWESILQLYNQLLQLEYSPIAALNRTYALYRARGKQQAINEAGKLNFTDNHFYYVLLGELYTGIDNEKARTCLEKAVALAKTATDKQTIVKRSQTLI